MQKRSAPSRKAVLRKPAEWAANEGSKRLIHTTRSVSSSLMRAGDRRDCLPSALDPSEDPWEARRSQSLARAQGSVSDDGARSMHRER